MIAHIKTEKLKVKYIGILSRFKKRKVAIENDILIVLSGPEPQRSLLEERLIEKLKEVPKKIILVRGKVEDIQTTSKAGKIIVHNFKKAKALEDLILKSETIIARSGYTTLMDLAKLDKKGLFIPTPGQTEQEYLAARLEKYGISPYCRQDKFEVNQIDRVKGFKGLGSLYRDNTIMLRDLFSLFDGK
jgi:predicted glycosyltransferase